jgi:hypothetical protein
MIAYYVAEPEFTMYRDHAVKVGQPFTEAGRSYVAKKVVPSADGSTGSILAEYADGLD